jgi:hypothetical protein
MSMCAAVCRAEGLQWVDNGMCATHPEVINPDLLAFFKA